MLLLLDSLLQETAKKDIKEIFIMGNLTSRQRAEEEAESSSSGSAYRYPPKSGNYFGSHFIMGGEKFDSPQPESFLFGDNCDLNFLGSKPVPFPYPPPQANEPTKTLKSLVNIRRDSLHHLHWGCIERRHYSCGCRWQ